MIRYPLAWNPILEYWQEIESGREIVCNKLRKTYEKIVYDLNNPGEYYYSPKRANHVIEFAENFCRHSKGKFGGKPVTLELWEKAMLATMFGFIDIDGNRKYREVILIVGKKNGKSLISSVVGNYLFLADGEAGPEVYAVATKKDQAKIIWLEAKRMIKKSPALSKRVRPLVAELDCDDNDGVFKPLASDSDTLDGLNIHGGLMDEIHQWKNGKALYDIIADGVSAREQPLIFMTSTAGVIREDIYDQKYSEAERIINGYFDPDGYHDERMIAFIYELDKREEWTDPKCWRKANPGLGTIKNLKTLAEKVERAKLNPNLVKNLVCKEFNIRETSSEAWLTFEQINNTATFSIDTQAKTMTVRYLDGDEWKEATGPAPRYGIGGGDLSSSVDLTAGCIMFRVPWIDFVFYIHMYWLPADLLERRAKEDKIPYDVWHERGLLRTCNGNKVTYGDVTQWFKDVRDELDIYIFDVGYDSWSANYWVDEMSQEFGKACMTPIIQGKKTLSAPMKVLGAELDSKKVIYNNNPITKWCLTNTAKEEDVNGNIQPHKTSHATRRIDGFAAMLDAFVVYQNKYGEYMSVI